MTDLILTSRPEAWDDYFARATRFTEGYPDDIKDLPIREFRTMFDDESIRSIRIGRSGQCVTITFREPSSGTTLADQFGGDPYSHYVHARIEAVAGGFRAIYDIDLFGRDFAMLHEFRESLARLYSFETQEAKLETLEAELQIDIKGDGRGNFRADCMARTSSVQGYPRLTFDLEFDQTEIPRIVAELDAVLGPPRK